MDNQNNKNWIPFGVLGAFIGGSLIVSMIIGALVFYKVKSFDNALSVTGSAKMAVTSDNAKWATALTRRVNTNTIQGGYTQIAKDLEITKKYLKEKGITDEHIIVSPIFMNEVYQQYPASVKEYTLDQTIEVKSDDVALVTELSKNIQALVMQGVFISTRSLEYYYSKLPEARVSLLAEAIKDAKARAGRLAESSGKSVGTLKSASSGVVQVISANSTDVSDYGSYDTSQIEKEVMVTVKASFTLN